MSFNPSDADYDALDAAADDFVEFEEANAFDVADDDDGLVAEWADEDGEWELYDGDGYTDAEADADTLASAGYGTDEDYGYYG